MQQPGKYILAINCGSSSLKFGLYHNHSFKCELSGSITNIDTDHGLFKITNCKGEEIKNCSENFNNHYGAARELLTWIKGQQFPLLAIGHRIVLGGPDKQAAELITPSLIHELSNYIYLAPNHLPYELNTIKVFNDGIAGIPQVVCYDTAFHHDMPPSAKYYPLPDCYRKEGLIRYGFHGLSYEYIVSKLAEDTPDFKKKKVIIAHLGSGASMAAVEHGKSIDTTMGISPTGGMVMSTRSGDLDPGVVLFLLKKPNTSVDDVDDLLSKNAGLKAIAGTGDIRQLLNEEDHNEKAAQALGLFCYQARKSIGALAAALGGLDMLVFTGGVGENSSTIRERICQKLDFLGIDVHHRSNKQNYDIVSSKHSRATVRVIPTNEELMIVKHAIKAANKKFIEEYENID